MTFWIVIGVIVLIGAVGDRRLQRPGRRPQPGADRVEPDRRAAQAPPRPHSQPGAGGEGRHGLRAGDAHQGGPGAQQRRRRVRARRSPAPPKRRSRQATRGLFALVESYPQLKANDNVKQLQEELTTTENKIAFSRQFYNDSVNAYNTRRQSFPAVLAAASLGFGPIELFNMPETEREVPKVALR